MTTDKEPFYEAKYKEESGYSCPILKVTIGEGKIGISGYADTGCDSGISMLKEQVKGMNIGIKISDEPSPCVMADGHIIGADEYLAVAYINGEKRNIVISVIDPKKDMGYVSVEETTPLIGREFLDTFDVLFKGKEKEISLFKC